MLPIRNEATERNFEVSQHKFNLDKAVLKEDVVAFIVIIVTVLLLIPIYCCKQ
jgi:hypothetical protein